MVRGRLLARGLLVAALICAAAGAYYLLDFAGEQRALRAFLDAQPALVTPGDPLQTVRSLTSYLGTLPDEETTGRAGYINPLYRFLKARPLEVLRLGGYCGNKSRLLIAFLGILDIPARLAYLYNERGLEQPQIGQPYVTAFVEAEIDRRWIVADPLLGVVFENAAGLPATTAELAENLSLITQQAPPWYTPEMFDYLDIRHLHWSKFPAGEPLRHLLSRLGLGDRVDTIAYPAWAHRPNLVMAGGFGLLVLPLAGGGMWLTRRSRETLR